MVLKNAKEMWTEVSKSSKAKKSKPVNRTAASQAAPAWGPSHCGPPFSCKNILPYHMKTSLCDGNNKDLWFFS
jgi:hypothetical protein